MKNLNIYGVPNLTANVTLREKEHGLLLIYTLPCTKDFPEISFIRKGRGYFRLGKIVPYQSNMGQALTEAYYATKRESMLRLNTFKLKKLQYKVDNLRKNSIPTQLTLF